MKVSYDGAFQLVQCLSANVHKSNSLLEKQIFVLCLSMKLLAGHFAVGVADPFLVSGGKV